MKKGQTVLNVTKEQREAIFQIADSVGAPVWNQTRSHKDLTNGFPHIYWDGEDVLACRGEEHREIVSLGQFIDELLKYKKTITVKLNDSYSAEIGNGVVKVGCQTFEFERIEALYSAIKNEKK